MAGKMEEPAVAKKQPTPAFLEKLFDILEDNRSYSHLIAWQPDGNSFIIKKVNEFSETVLPRYFKHSNIQSYIRQLNMYGFSKTRHDSNHHEFTHKLFQRGRRDLLPMIRRKTQQNPPKIAGSGTPTVPIDNPSQSIVGNNFGKSLFPPPLLPMGTFLGNQTNNLSSEASQSSTEEVESESSLIVHLQNRVLSLEEQVNQLSKVCGDLLNQHNLLCDALNKSKGINCNAPMDSNNTDTSSVKRKIESIGKDMAATNLDNHEDALGSPLKRIRAVCDSDSNSASAASSSNFASNSNNSDANADPSGLTKSLSVYAVKEERGGSISSHTDTTTASSSSMSTVSRSPGALDSNCLVDFQEFKVLKQSPLCPDIYKIAIISNLPANVLSNDSSSSTNSSLITNPRVKSTDKRHHFYSHGDPDVALLLAKVGGNRMDFGGLAAITDAASLLDNNHKEESSATLAEGMGKDVENNGLKTVDEGTLRLKYPLFTASALAASQLNHQHWNDHDSNSTNTNIQQNVSARNNVDNVSNHDNQQQFSQDHNQQLNEVTQVAKAGGPLMKAYSIG